MAKQYLGRSGRDSAGDTLDPQWYLDNGAVVRHHWGRDKIMTPADAIAELEGEAVHQEQCGDSLGARNARDTIAKIRQAFGTVAA